MNPFIVSRRTTLQIALAALSGSIVGMPRFAAAQDDSSGTWNWGGNPGHTGELPGPGLDLDGALGELWRMPLEEFSREGYSNLVGAMGYQNGVVYVRNRDLLWARRLSDGELLWTQSPATLMVPEMPEDSSVASPVANVDETWFRREFAIDGDVVLATLNDGHLWGIDAITGELRWDFDTESDVAYAPTVFDHVAYLTSGDGVIAVELGDQPSMRWKTEVLGWTLGLHDGFVYVSAIGSDGRFSEVRAFNAEDGSEYWRSSLDYHGELVDAYGISSDGVVIGARNDVDSRASVVMMDHEGNISWNMANDASDYNDSWILGGTVTSISVSGSGYGDDSLFSRYAANGNPNWRLDLDRSRWSPISREPVLCAGRAYALFRDEYQGERVLVIIDPANGEVFGVRNSNLFPLFIADGMMIAQDFDSDEIVAIGPVPAVLQAGGRATVTEDTTLRGAPSESAIERSTLPAGAVVEVTGDSETANETEWVPVYDRDSDEQGWLPVDVLQGQDGSIRVTSINVNEFGQFTAFPKFTSGTNAEITEQVTMRGAPSETSAEKSTLEAGTLVTVASPPTETDDGEWCAVTVDETGESGWVPVSVLTLASSA